MIELVFERKVVCAVLLAFGAGFVQFARAATSPPAQKARPRPWITIVLARSDFSHSCAHAVLVTLLVLARVGNVICMHTFSLPMILRAIDPFSELSFFGLFSSIVLNPYVELKTTSSASSPGCSCTNSSIFVVLVYYATCQSLFPSNLHPPCN